MISDLKTVIVVVILIFSSGCRYSEPELNPGDPHSGFPNTWIDSRGRSVTLESAPNRIISLAPSITETLFALGVQERIAAVTRYCRWPKEAASLKQTGGISDPSIESLISIDPDLILCTLLTSNEIVRQMENLGLTVMVLRQLTIKDILKESKILAEMTDAKKTGRDFLESNEKKYRLLHRRQLDSAKEQSVKALLLYGPEGYYSCGKGSFAGEIIELAGGVNLAEQSGADWQQLSKESLVAWNPDVLILAFDDSGKSATSKAEKRIESFRNDPSLKRITAVREDRFLVMTNSILSVPGPRIWKAVEMMTT